MEAKTTPVEFKIPDDLDDVSAVFGASRKHYLTREQMGDEFYLSRHPMARIAQTLFFKGGKLADHGIQFRDGINKAKAMLAIRALLSSFEPKHEVKIGTVGVALHQWCEPIKGKA